MKQIVVILILSLVFVSALAEGSAMSKIFYRRRLNLPIRPFLGFCLAVSAFYTTVAIAEISPPSEGTWLAQNYLSPRSKFLLLKETPILRIFLATPADCTDVDTVPGTAEIDSLIARANDATRTIVNNVTGLPSKIDEFEMRISPLIPDWSRLRSYMFPLNIGLTVGADFRCANASPKATFQFKRTIQAAEETATGVPLIYVGLDEAKSEPNAHIHTLSHEMGHVFLRTIGVNDSILEETIPDFLELSLNNYDPRIGLGMGKLERSLIEVILARTDLNENVREYNVARLALVSDEALRDLRNPKSISGAGAYPQVYIVSAHVNAYFWRLSQIVPKDLLFASVVEEIARKKPDIFIDSGLTFATAVTKRLISKVPSLQKDASLTKLIAENTGLPLCGSALPEMVLDGRGWHPDSGQTNPILVSFFDQQTSLIGYKVFYSISDTMPITDLQRNGGAVCANPGISYSASSLTGECQTHMDFKQFSNEMRGKCLGK